MERDEFVDLVRRVEAGDTQRFFEEVEPFFPNLKRLSRSMLPNPADAEEVVQETILKALQHIGQLRDVQCFKGWLFQIAVNEARLRMRNNRRSGIELQAEPLDQEEDSSSIMALDRLVDKGALPSEIVERSELLAAMRRGIHSLEPNYREVFVLKDVQGFSVKHTAIILGLSEATVHTRSHRARLKMRKLMAPHFRPACAKWKPLPVGLETPLRYKNKVVSCRRALDLLSSYTDAMISEQSRAEIEAQLKRCSKCAMMMDTREKVIYLVAGEEMFDHPFDCKKRWEHARAAFSQATRQSVETQKS